jgi:hypothetical protein
LPRTLKIFYHDNCFDGAASAAVFADFYRARVDAEAEIVYQGVQHQRGDPFASHAIDGDENACVDFRYSPASRMTWWFDHHHSAFQPAELRAHFDADDSGQKFYDPTAPSCTRFEVRVLSEHFDYRLPHSFTELIHWAEIIDSASFTDATTAVDLELPALQIMTWLEHNRDHGACHRLIAEMGHRSLADIAAEAWMKEPLAPVLAAHRRNIELIRGRAELTEGVVFFDLIDEAVAAHNKFISYYLYPQARYTVALTLFPERVKISVGSNPWARPEGHNIAEICERFGGGGHPVVGAISLPPTEIDRAREIAAIVRRELAE